MEGSAKGGTLKLGGEHFLREGDFQEENMGGGEKGCSTLREEI